MTTLRMFRNQSLMQNSCLAALRSTICRIDTTREACHQLLGRITSLRAETIHPRFLRWITGAVTGTKSSHTARGTTTCQDLLTLPNTEATSKSLEGAMTWDCQVLITHWISCRRSTNKKKTIWGNIMASFTNPRVENRSWRQHWKVNWIWGRNLSCRFRIILNWRI